MVLLGKSSTNGRFSTAMFAWERMSGLGMGDNGDRYRSRHLQRRVFAICHADAAVEQVG
jgi:hypothetical protein